MTRAIVEHRIANPLVIIDEIGLAAERMGTNGGGNLPGLIPALMSLIEPTIARAWTDLCLQIDFDVSRVSWVMTTNAHTHLPQPLLDRCRLVTCRVLTGEELLGATFRMGAGRLWDTAGEAEGTAAFAVIVAQIQSKPCLSPRTLARLVDRLEEIAVRTVLM